MTPDKCPKCGAARHPANYIEPRFTCGSHIQSFNGRVVQSYICVTGERNQLLARVKRLEEAGDSLAVNLDAMAHGQWSGPLIALDGWAQAKEAKP